MGNRITRLVEGQSSWEGEPQRLATRGRLLAAGVALLLVGGTAWIAFGDHGAGAPTEAAQQVQESVPTSDSPRTTTPAAPLPTTLPTAAPKNVRWELVQTVAVPSSPAGPRRQHGAVRAGFEHSPEGALIAALQISTRRLVTPAGGWRQVNLEQVMPGPGRDRFMRLRAQVDDALPAGGVGQTAGFKFISYTVDVATIEIATRFPGKATFQLSNLTVQWDRGDWRLVLQPDGSDSSSASSTDSLGSFIPFGGV